MKRKKVFDQQVWQKMYISRRPECTFPSMKPSDGSIMLGDCFSSEETGKLLTNTTKTEGAKCRECRLENLLQPAKALRPSTGATTNLQHELAWNSLDQSISVTLQDFVISRPRSKKNVNLASQIISNPQVSFCTILIWTAPIKSV